MDCGKASTNLPSEEQLPVIRGRLSRIRESDGVLPHSYFGANSRTAEFQHSHLGDIAQKRAMLTNSRIRVGKHRRIQLLPGEHHPKGWIGLNSQIPVENIIQPTNQLKSVHRLHQPADTASKPHRTADAPTSRSAAHQPTAPQPPTAAPPASRDSGSARAAGSIRRTPAATPVRRWPGRACPQQGTASHTRTRRTQSRAHR